MIIMCFQPRVIMHRVALCVCIFKDLRAQFVKVMCDVRTVLPLRSRLPLGGANVMMTTSTRVRNKAPCSMGPIVDDTDLRWFSYVMVTSSLARHANHL